MLGSKKETIFEKKLSSLEPDSSIAIIGMRGMGKTTLIREFLYWNYKRIRLPLVISGTAGTNGDFTGIVPDMMIYDKYVPRVVNTFITDQNILNKKIEIGECSKKIKRLGCFICDDILGTDPVWKKDPNFQRIIISGRHFHITNIISSQNVLGVPPYFRENIDYLLFRVKGERPIKHIFNNFWNPIFGEYQKFKSYLSVIMKKPYCWMLLDNKRGVSTLQQYLFFVKPLDPKIVPKKKVGIKLLWNLHKEYYNSDWLLKMSNTYSAMEKKSKKFMEEEEMKNIVLVSDDKDNKDNKKIKKDEYQKETLVDLL